MSGNLGAYIGVSITSILGSYAFVDFKSEWLPTVIMVVFVIACAVLNGFVGAMIQEKISKKYAKWIGKKKSQKQLLVV